MSATTQAIDTGMGASCAWTTNSTFAPKILSISGLKRMVAELDATPLNATVTSPALVADQEVIPGDMIENGTLEIEFMWNTSDALPKLSEVDTLTVTLPIRTAEATAAKIAGTGFFKEYDFPPLQKGEIQKGKLTWKFDGYTGPIYTAGA